MLRTALSHQVTSSAFFPAGRTADATPITFDALELVRADLARRKSPGDAILNWRTWFN
jgi:hypothetical protein